MKGKMQHGHLVCVFLIIAAWYLSWTQSAASTLLVESEFTNHSKVEMQQSNETYWNIALKFLHKPGWVSKNNAHSSSGWLCLSSEIPFHCTNITLCWHNVNWAEAAMRIWNKKVHILYIGYMVSPAEMGEGTAITEIAALTGWGALSRQEERKRSAW